MVLMPKFVLADETILSLRGQACWTKPELTIKDTDGSFLICRNGKFMFAKEARRIKEVKLGPPCVDANGSNTRPDGSLYSCRLGKDGTLYIE